MLTDALATHGHFSWGVSVPPDLFAVLSWRDKPRTEMPLLIYCPSYIHRTSGFSFISLLVVSMFALSSRAPHALIVHVPRHVINCE